MTRPYVLVFVGPTITQRRRSGIHRVTVETARALSAACEIDLVRWDALEGGLRFLDLAELDSLFGPGSWPTGIRLRRTARKLGRPFREQLERPEETWLLATEVVWHEEHGTEHFARVLTECRIWGVRTAAIFYDLIPIRNDVYRGGAALHEAYVAELVRADLLIPISVHSGQDLSTLWREREVENTPPIRPILLPDGGFAPRRSSAVRQPRPERLITLLGAVEPRKRQVQFLEAMVAARARSPAVAEFRVMVIGSLHAYVAAPFNAILARNAWVEFHDYSPDAEVRSALERSAFSAFLSEDEGYGLPVSESLALGTPCLCANFGAMAEIAAGGGCLTVDVRDPKALEQAIVELCQSPDRLPALRAELATRRFNGWDDYARSIAGALNDAPLRRADPIRPVTVGALRVDARLLSDKDFGALAQADVLAFNTDRDRTDFADEARRRSWPALLPARIPIGSPEPATASLGQARAKRAEVAAVEEAFARARATIPPDEPSRPVALRLLISTFNRCAFVTANVRWILNSVLTKETEGVDLVVVDGGSTDGTVEALGDIVDARLRVIASPVNVGMLAAWREASHLRGAEYVWVIGDDDFVACGGVKRVLAALRANPGLPFGFANFAVYHRARLGPADRAVDLIAEARPLAAVVAPDQVMSVRQAAEQTDNLFTAIYAIIWRADTLAAAYDHAFDGAPFSNMIEAIPCTELILRHYADCDVFWLAEILISGNAHNSWSRHRPRWHGVVMPQAFALAREVGVDGAKLQDWADMHARLFDEAIEITKDRGEDPRLTVRELDLARTLFRKAVHAGPAL